MPEASDHEPGAEIPQLFLVRFARRHECRRLDPEQVLLPRGRTSAEREHVMDPHDRAPAPTCSDSRVLGLLARCRGNLNFRERLIRGLVSLGLAAELRKLV